jgi:DNA-binding NarL/FixJ family response regulator
LIGELAESTTTVILTTRATQDDACHAVAAGVFGYVDTHLPPDAIRRSILGAMRGEHAYSRRVLSTLIRSGRWLRAANALPLTPRQRQVIMLIAKGAADKEIARSLGITTATAQKHVTNLLRRLNVPNRAAAVAVMSSAYPL